MMWLPESVKMRSQPRRSRERATMSAPRRASVMRHPSPSECVAAFARRNLAGAARNGWGKSAWPPRDGDEPSQRCAAANRNLLAGDRRCVGGEKIGNEGRDFLGTNPAAD